MADFIFYSDGSCIPSTKKGGWATIVIPKKGYPLIIRGTAEETTNNRMEIQAILEAFKYVHNHVENPEQMKLKLYSDSKYVLSTMSSNLERWAKTLWIKNNMLVKNADQWKRLRVLYNLYPHMELNHVKGHNGNYWNEVCDCIAGLEAGKGKKRG